MHETSMTLLSEREAELFLLGRQTRRYCAMVRIDPEEPFTLLVDVRDKYLEYYIEAVKAFNREFPGPVGPAPLQGEQDWEAQILALLESRPTEAFRPVDVAAHLHGLRTSEAEEHLIALRLQGKLQLAPAQTTLASQYQALPPKRVDRYANLPERVRELLSRDAASSFTAEQVADSLCLPPDAYRQLCCQNVLSGLCIENTIHCVNPKEPAAKAQYKFGPKPVDPFANLEERVLKVLQDDPGGLYDYTDVIRALEPLPDGSCARCTGALKALCAANKIHEAVVRKNKMPQYKFGPEPKANRTENTMTDINEQVVRRLAAATPAAAVAAWLCNEGWTLAPVIGNAGPQGEFLKHPAGPWPRRFSGGPVVGPSQTDGWPQELLCAKFDAIAAGIRAKEKPTSGDIAEASKVEAGWTIVTRDAHGAPNLLQNLGTQIPNWLFRAASGFVYGRLTWDKEGSLDARRRKFNAIVTFLEANEPVLPTSGAPREWRVHGTNACGDVICIMREDGAWISWTGGPQYRVYSCRVPGEDSQRFDVDTPENAQLREFFNKTVAALINKPTEDNSISANRVEPPADADLGADPIKWAEAFARLGCMPARDVVVAWFTNAMETAQAAALEAAKPEEPAKREATFVISRQELQDAVNQARLCAPEADDAITAAACRLRDVFWHAPRYQAEAYIHLTDPQVDKILHRGCREDNWASELAALLSTAQELLRNKEEPDA